MKPDPCPFCEKTELESSVDAYFIPDDKVRIGCFDCGARGPAVKRERGGREEATRAWNTRPGEKAARVEALMDARERLFALPTFSLPSGSIQSIQISAVEIVMDEQILAEGAKGQ